MNAKRILVLGCSGSGKSTLTRALSKKYGLPAVYIDFHYWQPNWTAPPIDQWRKKITEIANEKEWIMDGTFSESFDIRFPLADKIIVFNLPRCICMYRVLKRYFQYRNVRRPDMAEGCNESINFEFYRYVWTYHKKVMPQIYEAIEKYGCTNKVVFLNSKADVEALL